ncbi:MAG: hypothetical protein U0S12_01825 [Fimbriimonadales bacterium]
MKDYATHRVGYEGIWDGTMIAGSWAMTYEEDIFDAGLFEIWPRARHMAENARGTDARIGLVRLSPFYFRQDAL